MSDTTDAYHAAYRAAWQYRGDVVQEALEDVREQVAAGEDKEDALQAYADDCETVIYTGRAWVYCLGSRNTDAYRDDIGEEPPSIEARACFAIMADVREHPDWDSIGGDAGEDDDPEDWEDAAEQHVCDVCRSDGPEHCPTMQDLLKAKESAEG